MRKQLFISRSINQSKLIMQTEQFLDNSVERRPRRKRDKYCKIPLKSKLIFYEKVINQHGNLRQIAQKLGIKYSTAKTLIRNYKFLSEEVDEDMVRTLVHDFDFKHQPRRQASYQALDDHTGNSSPPGRGEPDRDSKLVFVPRVQIVSSLMGCQSNNLYFLYAPYSSQKKPNPLPSSLRPASPPKNRHAVDVSFMAYFICYKTSPNLFLFQKL